MDALNINAIAQKLPSLLWFLVPSYLQGAEARAKLRPTKLTPTTYLDGLRGLCALFVVFYHHSYQNFHSNTGYGANGAHYDFLKLPFVRLLYQGSPGVAIFFVISGYVLSYRAVALARSSDFEKMFSVLSSMTFRRFFRLYLPTAIATFMTAFFARLGLFELTKKYSEAHPVVKERHALHFNTTFAQLKHWSKATFELVEAYDWSKQTGSPYDPHLWTIPVEFRCSLFLFLILLGTSRLRPKWRFVVASVIFLHANLKSRWEMMLFVFGMMMAEYDILRGAHSSNQDQPLHGSSKTTERGQLDRLLLKGFWILVNVVSLYFLSYPDVDGPMTPQYSSLNLATPAWWKVPRSKYWHTMGAILFMASLSHMPRYQAFFNSRFIFYLGKISYALYVTHGPVLHSIGYMIEERTFQFTRADAKSGYATGWVMGFVFILPVVMWVADVFWRAVDMPSVRFARWLEASLVAPTGEKRGGFSLG